MTPQALSALYGSISKWQGIVDGRIENRGASNCPLCAEFIDGDHRVGDANGSGAVAKRTLRSHCDGCPVAERTGHVFCKRTPYSEYALLEDEIEDNPDNATEYHYNELSRLARAELAFLVSLLPEGERS